MLPEGDTNAAKSMEISQEDIDNVATAPPERWCTSSKDYMTAGDIFMNVARSPNEYLSSLGETTPELQRAILERLLKLEADRLKNEAMTLRFVAAHTTIPVLRVLADYEDKNGHYVLITEFITQAVPLHVLDLSREARAPIIQDMEGYRAQMRNIRSNRIQSFIDGQVCCLHGKLRDQTLGSSFREAPEPIFSLCHCDLNQSNILVHQVDGVWRVRAIIDWEHAGFHPQELDDSNSFYDRPERGVVEGDLGPEVYQKVLDWMENKKGVEEGGRKKRERRNKRDRRRLLLYERVVHIERVLVFPQVVLLMLNLEYYGF